MKNTKFCMRVNEEDKRLLEKDAKEENRSMGNLLLWCWEQWRENKKRR